MATVNTGGRLSWGSAFGLGRGGKLEARRLLGSGRALPVWAAPLHSHSTPPTDTLLSPVEPTPESG
jgi:hypothetical protein